MRYLVLCCVLCYVQQTANAATPVFEQINGTSTSTSVADVTQAFGTNVTAGNALVAAHVLATASSTSTPETITFSDTANGSNWTALGATQAQVLNTNSITPGEITIAVLLNSAGGACTVTATRSGTGTKTRILQIYEVSNATAVHLINMEESGASSVASFDLFQPSVTIPADSAVVGVACPSGFSGAGDPVWPWGTIGPDSDGSYSYRKVDSFVYTTEQTSYAGTYTNNSVSRQWATGIVVLTDSGGGGSPSLVPILQHHKKRQGR